MVRKGFRLDGNRFIKSAFSIKENTEIDQIKGRIILHYHSLEKGFTNRNFRYGFGKRAYTALIQALYEFKNMGFNTEDVSFQTGVSVLQEYVNIHKSKDVDTSYIQSVIDDLGVKPITNYGGVIYLEKTNIVSDSSKDFSHVANSRHSIRDFSEEDVTLDDINKALELTERTPSVCNRQPWKVHVIKNKELLEKVLKLQGGLTAQGNPEYGNILTYRK